jgi:predicted thioesterase
LKNKILHIFLEIIFLQGRKIINHKQNSANSCYPTNMKRKFAVNSSMLNNFFVPLPTMDFQIEKGIKGYKEHQVEMSDTAQAYGSGLLQVFATPAMIALMENAAHNSLNEFLPSGWTSVGTTLHIEHCKATPVGATICCESVLELVEGRKLTFGVIAYDQAGTVGKGIHIRCLVEVEKFMEKIKSAGGN